MYCHHRSGAFVSCFRVLSPNFITPTFTETFPRGKDVDTNHESCGHKRWQIWNHKVSVKVADINHESRIQKQSRHVQLFATKSMTSPRQTRLCRSNEI